MVMLRRLAVTRAALLAGWLIIVGAILPGCGAMSTSEFESLVSELVGSTKTLNTTVALRIVNQSSAELTLEVLVDDEMQTLTCSSQDICEFPLELCPEVIELVSERRFDSRGTFLGGQNFTDAAAYRLTRDDFQCHETVIFRFTESNTEILVL